jgi:hypothetical protein
MVRVLCICAVVAAVLPACESSENSLRNKRPSEQADPNPGFEVSRVYEGGETASFENQFARVEVPAEAISGQSFKITLRKTSVPDSELGRELVLATSDQTCVEVAIVDSNNEIIQASGIRDAIRFTAKSDLAKFNDPVLAAVVIQGNQETGVYFETAASNSLVLSLAVEQMIRELGFSAKAVHLYFAVVERSRLGPKFSKFGSSEDITVSSAPIVKTPSSGTSMSGTAEGTGTGGVDDPPPSIRECPTGFVLVPADNSAEVNTKQFCVMKYEAKNQAGVALSLATGLPWSNIPRGSTAADPAGAWKKCRDLGDGYDLISNAQWQAIVRNAETARDNNNKLLNWYGTGEYLNRGHTDWSPDGALAASTDDDPCSGTQNPNCKNDSHFDFAQKRTHVLSNGSVIWDLGGNVSEWVKDDSTHAYYPTDESWYVILGNPGNGTPCLSSNGCSGLQGSAKAVFGPVGDYTSGACSLLDVEYCGFGKAYLSGAAGAIGRGGNWVNQLSGGVFQVYTHFSATSTSMNTHAGGFRCVFTGTTQ